MLYELRSTKSLDEIGRAIHEAAARHGFGVIAEHDLRETMRKKGLELDSACRIYEVCNPHQAKNAIEANGAISTALPCRISVYGREGDMRIATMRPTAMMAMFETPELAEVAKQVEEVVLKMMDEAA